MNRLVLLVVLVLLGVATLGCSAGSPSAREPVPQREPAPNPAAVLARQGAVQMAGALDSVANAREATLAALGRSRGETKRALDDALALIDSAGSAIADYSEAPAESDPAELTKWREKAAEAGNDALIDLGEARGIVASLPSEQATLARVIGVAESDVAEAIVALGGKVAGDRPEPGG